MVGSAFCFPGMGEEEFFLCGNVVCWWKSQTIVCLRERDCSNHLYFLYDLWWSVRDTNQTTSWSRSYFKCWSDPSINTVCPGLISWLVAEKLLPVWNLFSTFLKKGFPRVSFLAIFTTIVHAQQVSNFCHHESKNCCAHFEQAEFSKRTIFR